MTSTTGTSARSDELSGPWRLPLHRERDVATVLLIHNGAVGISLVTFFGIEKNIVVHACGGHLPLCSTFSKDSTISPPVSFVTSKNFWDGSRHTPLLFLLHTISTLFSKSHSLALAALPPISSTPHFSKACFSTHSSHCQCFFFFASQRPKHPGILFFFLQDLCTSSPRCRLCDLMQGSNTSLCTLDHCSTFC